MSFRQVWTTLHYDLYPLQEVQERFAKSSAVYRLFWGAKGGGKSYAMRAESVRQCLSRPWIRWIAFRRTFPEIDENMIQPLLVELPPWSYKYNQSKHTIKFNNWSTLRFAFCQSASDVLKYQGLEYDFVCIEELTHWTERERKTLMWCLRTNKPWVIPNFFASTNPWNVGHIRVKRLRIERNYIEGENPEDFEFIPAKVWDNQILLARNPRYVQNLMLLPDQDRRAYLDGDRDVFQWQYFKDWRREIHVCDPFVPTEWIVKRIVALDYWYNNPSAVYRMALDSQWEAYIYRELYVTEKTYEELLTLIRIMTPAAEKIDYIVADPAVVNKRSETNKSTFADECKKQKFKVKGWNNARLEWRTVYRQYMQPLQDPNNPEHITSKLHITTSCPNLIRTLPNLVYDKKNVEDLDTRGEDHSADATRYGLMDFWKPSVSFNEVKNLNEALAKKTEAAISKSVAFRNKNAKRKDKWFIGKKF